MSTPLSRYLRQLREAKGVGLKIAAPDIGVTYTYLSKLENGIVGPSDKTLELLASYYGEDAGALMILAGRLPPDIVASIANDPEAAIALLREKFGGRGHPRAAD